MRLYNRVISQVLFVMLGLSSCVTEKFDDINALEQHTRSGYVYFRIETTDRLTRASSDDLEPDGNDNHSSGDLVNGQELEHKIGAAGNFCLFFSDKGGFVNAFPLELAKIDPVPDKPVGGDQHVREAVYGVKITVDEDEVFPKQFLVVLNGQSVYQKLSALTPGMTVDEVLEQIWEDENPLKIGKNDDGLFTMTSSIYMDGSEKKSTVSITKDNIQQEGSFDPKKVVIAHVERVVAKFTLQLPKNENPTIFRPSENADLIVFAGFDSAGSVRYIAKKWRINVTGWSINALESKTYLFKNFNSSTNYFTGWNSSFDHRSYWSEDLHYTDTDYPWQYRWAMDSNCIDYEEKITDDGNANMLTNFSFFDLELDGPKSEETAGDMTKVVLYTPENTYDAPSVAGKLDDRDTVLACSHLLIGAELQLETAPNVFAPIDLYRDRSGLYYTSKQDCFAALMHAFNHSLSSQKVLDYTLYDWDNGGEINEEVVADSEGKYRLYYKGQELSDDYLKQVMQMDSDEFDEEIGCFSPAPLRRGDGKQVPWISMAIEKGDLTIQDAQGDPLQICKRIQDHLGFVKAGAVVRTANKNDIKSLLYEWIGSVDHFDMGRMYYAHGIDNPTATEDKPRRYGVVRNNWYRFNLSAINRIGIPVDDPKQPIVPETVGFNDLINVSIYLLPWHTVTTTTPEMPEK